VIVPAESLGQPHWPTQIEYQEALEFPAQCFEEVELRSATVADRTAFGLPLPITGQFANVYRLATPDGRAFAVRLFLRSLPGRDKHWTALMRYFASLPDLPAALAPFSYHPAGIRVGVGRFPTVTHPWVEGIPLNTYLEKNLYDAAALRRLADAWRLVIRFLEQARFAHGDLQHGNILVEETTGSVRLIDYDGSFVPELAGVVNREVGHASYQHPRRTAADYGPLMDRFPALVIYITLRLLAVAPYLWFRLDNGDNLLFRPEDFADPATSRGFAVFREALRPFPIERNLARVLRDASVGPLSLVPDLDRADLAATA
jgi:hypothetical protein